MSGQLHSELLKQRTTSTNVVLLVAMVVLISLVVLLHMTTLPAQDLSDRTGQLKVLGLGTTFGMIFASLLGAMSVTGEIRHGLIRPTFLASPKRTRVIAAKVAAGAIAGAAFGLLAEVLAVGVVAQPSPAAASTSHRPVPTSSSSSPAAPSQPRFGP